jgi:hexosaminidase
MSGNSFFITDKTAIVVDSSSEELPALGRYLSEKLQPATGFDLPSSVGEKSAKSGSIFLGLKDDTQLGAEGYELVVDENHVTLTANAPAGLFLGIQTLRQLLPEEIERSSADPSKEWEIASCTIRDSPEYSWRGSMLDVARHFFQVQDVKRYIDLIAFYKMNTLHLHLSDDQGWRIEIKSWPDLTKIGSLTQVGGGKGGFYTQEEYQDIVDYARSRYVTVIPEIDMPGHINSALVSYKELNLGPAITREPASRNPHGPVAGKVHTGIEVGFSTLDAKKDVTFKFVADVLREIAAMTPGPYLHIGGDEAAVTKKPDYINFINRFRQMVKENGKKMVGWEEAAQGDIDSTTTIQYWSNQKYAKMAAEKGAKLIFSPAQKVYLDMKYDSTTKLGLNWAAYIEVDSSYMWDPANYVDGIGRDQILGVEAPLWSETLVTMDDIEYMLFPRMPGVAEIGWTKPEDRKWEDYKTRLANQAPRWETMGINFYRSPKVQWVVPKANSQPPG